MTPPRNVFRARAGIAEIVALTALFGLSAFVGAGIWQGFHPPPTPAAVDRSRWLPTSLLAGPARQTGVAPTVGLRAPASERQTPGSSVPVGAPSALPPSTASTRTPIESPLADAGTPIGTRGPVHTGKFVPDAMDRVQLPALAMTESLALAGTPEKLPEAIRRRRAPSAEGASPTIWSSAVFPGGGELAIRHWDANVRERRDLQEDKELLSQGSDTHALALRRLSEGRLPSVAEPSDFIQSLDQDLALPDRGVSVSLELAPDPVDPSVRLLRVGLRAARAESAARPAHYVLVVDRSGSMGLPTIDALTRRAVRSVVDALGPDDQISLVAYAGDVRSVIGPLHARDGGQIQAALDVHTPDGSSSIAAGLRAADALISASRGPSQVLLISDGDANEDSVQRLGELTRGWANRGVNVHTVAVRDDGRSATGLATLSDDTGGDHIFVGDLAAARAVGARLTEQAHTTTEVELELEMAPDRVEQWAQFGGEQYASDEPAQMRLTLAPGSERTLLFRIRSKVEGRGHWLNLRLEGRDSNGHPVSVRRRLEGREDRRAFRRTSRAFRMTWGAAALAEALVRQGPIDPILALLPRSLRPAHSEDHELLRAAQRAARLLDAPRVGAAETDAMRAASADHAPALLVCASQARVHQPALSGQWVFELRVVDGSVVHVRTPGQAAGRFESCAVQSTRSWKLPTAFSGTVILPVELGPAAPSAPA